MNQYSVDFKLKIVKMILNEHISKKSIMREYNVATKTQRQWVHKYQSEGISGLVSKRKIRDKIPTNQEEESVESLKHEILMLKVEIERLKRGYCNEDAKYVKKEILNYEYTLVHKFRVKYYINNLCEYMEISRSGYYRWLQRRENKTARQETKETLKMLIKNYHLIHPEKGYRALRKDIINETGWIVSYYLMHQCFREMGIYSRARRRAFRRPKGVSDKFPNLINGDWSTTRPFEKVCSDTTLLKHDGKKYDLNLHVDVFNNEIVGHNCTNSKHGNGVMNHLKSLQDFLRIKEERGYGDDHTILHSDQGIVYTSKRFEKAHKEYPITRSMSRAGTPTDNPVIESLIGWIKSDLKHYIKLHDFKDINTAIELYIDYFNNHRVAYKLDYLTPVEYRTINGFT